MARALVAILAIAILFGVGVWGIGAATETAGSNYDIDGETFTPNAGSVTTLDHSNLPDTHYSESVEVFDNNGNLVDPGEDYVWFDNGTIKTVTGGDLDGLNSATIDYRYEVRTDDQQALIEIAAMFPRIAGAILPLLGLGILLVILRG